MLLPRLDIAVTVADDDTETTRYVSSIAGDLSLTFSVEDAFLSTGIVDPQGSVVATTKQQVVDGAAATVWSGLSLFDKYGNPVTGKTTDTGALDYGWLGGKERATDTSGLVLMGVRLYNSVTGHFTSVDPVKGGNTTRYTYPQDPQNSCDVTGETRAECNSAKKKMEYQLGVMADREKELIADEHGLPLYGKMSIDSHIQEFRSAQRGLKNALDRFEKWNCWRFGMKSPKNVWKSITRQPRLNSKIKRLNGKLVRTNSKEWKAYKGIGKKGGKVGGVGGIRSGSGRNLKI